ncbi:hypothetical protein [Povalibacter sp.]|uniref:hypothetical protein n=1 Tax=Povalibacter sp. TaxID=1962978 RepID=UPI002F3EE0FD
MMFANRMHALVLGAAGLLAGSNAVAQTPSLSPEPRPRVIEDRFRVEVTLLGASIDTRLRVDQSLTLPGTEINAEDDLGLDAFALMPQAEITLLPGKRHLIRLSGFSSRRSASTIIEEEIFFDDEVYEPGERVDSELNLTMFGLTYGYRFLVRDHAELTATLGIQITSVDVNALVRSRVVRDSESGVAPLPLLGVEGRYDFTERWSAEGRLQYLTANIEEVDGSILDARLAVTWRMNPYLVFGLGYRTFTIDIDSRDETDPGMVNMSFDGPLLFIRASL